MLPWALRFYRHHLPGALITVYDNESDDGTPDIARRNGCRVVSFSTLGQYDELALTRLRNNCWLDSPTPWVLVVDCDELACFSLSDLASFDAAGLNIVQFEGYNMVSMSDDMAETSLDHITHGARSSWYDKSLLFNRTSIAAMNFSPGSHQCSPRAKLFKRVRAGVLGHKLYHCKYISYHSLVQRYFQVRARSSKTNVERGLGHHYQVSDSQLLLEFRQVQSEAVDLSPVPFGPPHSIHI